jgi:DNA primase
VAGRSTEQLTERIRQASDIVDVISSYVTLKRAGRQFKGLCPFHNEKTPSFNVTPERQAFKCFGCGAGGDVFKFVQLRESVNFPEAIAILAQRAGISLETERATRSGNGKGLGKLEIERVNRWAAAWFQRQFASDSGRAACDYVASRGITEESIDRFGIGFAPTGWDSLVTAAQQKAIPPELLLAAGLARPRTEGTGLYDAFRNRLMFPIVDAMNRVVGFGGRTLGDDDAKYVNTSQNLLFDKGRCLYGLSTAKDAFREQKSAIIVEGYVDCIMAQQSGFVHTIATLGTALTADHVRLLRRYVDRAILVFDSDAAGQRAADQSLPLFLTETLEVLLANVPESKDPADYLLSSGPEAFAAVLTSAVGGLEFKWKQVLRQCRGDTTAPDRRRAVEEFLGLIARSGEFGACDPIQRGLVLNQVGKLLGLSGEEVNRQLRITARRLGTGSTAAASPSTASTTAFRNPVVLDAMDAVAKAVLEVLLNAPEYYEKIAAEFDPLEISNTQLKEIALALADMLERPEEWSLTGLISRFESVETAAKIMDLQTAGQRRGNYSGTVEGALTRLRQLREQRRLDELAAVHRDGSASLPNPHEPAGHELLQVARSRSHFASQRHLATPMTVGAEPSAS